MSEIGIKDQCFGVEVEMTGITREQAAHALADYFGTSPQYLGTGYDTWGATDPEGKVWKLMSDASIRAERKTRTGYTSNAGTSYRVEMVTPKLTYEELPKFQECIRRVRAAGAKVNSSCGIHVHVDAANHTEGDMFYIHVLGEVLAYKVDAIHTVLPTDTSLLQIEKGEDLVTLVTCTPFAINTHRLLVRGHRVLYTPDQEAVVAAGKPAASSWTQHYLIGLGIGLGAVAVVGGGYFLVRRHRHA